MSNYEQNLLESCRRIKLRKPDNYRTCTEWVKANLKACEHAPGGLVDMNGEAVCRPLQATRDDNHPEDRWQVMVKNDFTGQPIGLMASHIAFFLRRGHYQFDKV